MSRPPASPPLGAALSEPFDRRTPPPPWAEGDGLPWYEPGCNERVLDDHPSQEHDWASRRSAAVDAHVAFIQRSGTRRSGRPRTAGS